MALKRRLNLPNEYLVSLKRLYALEPEVFERLDGALRATSPTLAPWDFADDIASRLEGQKQSHIFNLIVTLSGLYTARSSSNLSIPDFVDAVCEVMESDEAANSPSDQSEVRDWALFKERLSRLLDIDQSLGISSKAFNVMVQHQHTYCQARVMSDLRPVFSSDPSEAPDAAMIIHTLKLTYHDGEEMKDFYVAMDVDDMKKLKQLLERAEKKTESLVSVLNASGIIHLAPRS